MSTLFMVALLLGNGGDEREVVRPPIRLLGITIVPGVGIRESTDYGLGERMLAQAKRSEPEKDFTPPTDKAADIATAESSKVRPRITDRNVGEIMRMADTIGKPTIQWVNCWPEWYTGCAEFFLEMSDAQHVVRHDETTSQEYIIIRLKNGEPGWCPASELNGKKSATKIRSIWQGEQPPKPERSISARRESYETFRAESSRAPAYASTAARPAQRSPVRLMESPGVPMRTAEAPRPVSRPPAPSPIRRGG